MSTLIVTEKNITAKKIASILSSGKLKTEKVLNYPVYTWEKNGSYRCFGLRGHILKVDFPDEYSKWEKVDLFQLIQAETIKVPIEKKLIKLIESEAKKAEVLIIATDFDREGELIGYDLASIAKKSNPNLVVKRARFSSLTKEEILKAFSELKEPFVNLALAGESRQIIDLVWGATLTRYLSLASRRLGKRFLSVGRVQSPTLAMIVKREEEIRNFVPEKYYQVHVLLKKDGKIFKAHFEDQKIKDKSLAEEIAEKIKSGKAVVALVSEKEVIQKQPSPFNTTEFLAASSSIYNISPGKAMQVAENLYTRGYISYPRVDNTVYPQTLNLRQIVNQLKAYEPVKVYAQEILQKKKIVPTRGKKESTDHPPIHPTGELPDGLSEPEAKIYDLVVRRFLATLGDPAIQLQTKVELEASGYRLFASGLKYIKEGFLKVYPFVRAKEEELPKLTSGEALEVVSAEVVEKETKPPARFSQAGLVREMERLGLGTKSTRHSIIQTLYDRGYIIGNPIQPTELGMAVGKAILNHMGPVATHEMTADLEEKMNAIEEGKETKETVIEVSRKDLEEVLIQIKPKEDEVRQAVWEGLNKDKVIGKCPVCGGELQIITSKKSKKRFIGCSNFQSEERRCSTTFPLPQKGLLLPAGKVCEHCGTPMVKLVTKGKKPWIFCPNPSCPESNLNREKSENKEAEKAKKGAG